MAGMRQWRFHVRPTGKGFMQVSLNTKLAGNQRCLRYRQIKNASHSPRSSTVRNRCYLGGTTAMTIWNKLFGRRKSEKTPSLRFEKGPDLGCFINDAGDLDHLWVSDARLARAHDDLKEELLAHISLGEAAGQFTCPLEVFIAYSRAAEWGLLRFVPNTWTDDGGCIISMNREALLERVRSEGADR